jgi:hypothetical protein
VTEVEAESEAPIEKASDAWTDLGLTLPVFVIYHLGVVFLPVRNAADPVTSELKALANQSLPLYASLTVAIGAAFVLVLAMLGRGKVLALHRFVIVGLEGVAYALAMRMIGGWALQALPLQAAAGGEESLLSGTYCDLVMSLGAGFYEELAFRVGLFGAGAWVIKVMFEKGATALVLLVGWALLEAVGFSAWHHVGPLADAFDMRVFAYRAVCGLVLTAIYVFRGFAPAVWTHVLYDVWAMSS